MRRRRKRNPLGLELLPLLLGTAAVAGVGFLIYKASQPSVVNSAGLPASTPTQASSPDQLAADLKAGTATVSAVASLLSDTSAASAAGSTYATLSDGTTIFNDGSGGFTDSNGNTLTADQVGNALLMS